MSGSASTPPTRGLFRVVTPDDVARMEVEEQEREARRRKDAEALAGGSKEALTDLARHIRNEFEVMRRHRQGAAGWNDRLMAALRMFNGEYEPDVLREIEQFGGSKIYARVVSVKCRGATALLRDIYLTGVRPWDVEPTPDPTLPDDVVESVDQVVAVEMATIAMTKSAMQAPGGAEMLAQAAGSGAMGGAMGGGGTPGFPSGGAFSGLQPPSESEVYERRDKLLSMAREAARKKAREHAKEVTRRLDDLLVEGGFYNALSEFMTDLPLFPFACIKGPVVRIVPTMKWVTPPEGGMARAEVEDTPRMFWERVSPFDLWWTPGAADIASANIIERVRFSRADLNAMLGLPGYDEDAIREVLRDYGQSGFTIEQDTTDQVRADAENRESPYMNESGVIEALLYTGHVQGRLLREYGWSRARVPDEDRDYAIQAWLIGRHVIKVQMSPSVTKRHPYYVTSFEKVPGTVIGNALPDILADIQAVCNAALRALNNNMGLASGPQVVVNEDMLAPGENADSFFPWKRWRTVSPAHGLGGSSQNLKPIEFFQPNPIAQQLLGVYEKFTQMADELSAIPRYITGSERLGGAGRTASGLAMLMGNASKILQTVAGNIDSDVFKPLLKNLHELVILTDDQGIFRGDEQIRVRGVTVAVQRETERQRQIEMLQATANPMDLEIIGMTGRAALLRAVMSDLGLDGEQIVPPEDEIARRQQQIQAAAAQAAQAGPEGPGGPTLPEEGESVAPGAPGAPEMPSRQQLSEMAAQAQGGQQGGENTGPMAATGPRTNLMRSA